MFKIRTPDELLQICLDNYTALYEDLMWDYYGDKSITSEQFQERSSAIFGERSVLSYLLRKLRLGEYIFIPDEYGNELVCFYDLAVGLTAKIAPDNVIRITLSPDLEYIAGESEKAKRRIISK